MSQQEKKSAIVDVLVHNYENITKNDSYNNFLKNGSIKELDHINAALINKVICGDDSFLKYGIITPKNGWSGDPIHEYTKLGMLGRIFQDFTFKDSESYSQIFKQFDRNLKYIIFWGCDFQFPTMLERSHEKIFNNLNFFIWTGNCSIDTVNFSNPPMVTTKIDMKYSFNDCDIENLSFHVDDDSPLELQNNRFGIITTKSKEIRIKDSTICLLQHTDISDKCDMSFDNVTINYNKNILKEVDHNKSSGYLNTFKLLLNNEGLYSEKETVKKYINYFTSRNNLIYRFLFWFNGGYTKWLIPLTFVLFSVVIKILILFLNPELYGKNSVTLVPVFYPFDMFKNVILNTLTWRFSLLRLVLFVLELVYILSMFSFLTFLKRKFGFKREK